MPTLHQYDYLMAIGTSFSLLDAYNIGANDVANAWATSVSSKSVSYRQAMILAAIFEFLGAVTVGARVTDTIKNGIIPLRAFRNNAGVQLLAFTCAITVSASWLMFCSYMSFTVSTTYSIIASIAGVGIATAGSNAVVWGWNNGKGMGAIFSGLLIAPAISAGFGAAMYLIVKYGVLRRTNAVRWAIYTGPVFFSFVVSVCTMSIIYKGAPSLGLSALSIGITAAAIVGTAAVVTLFAFLFWVPYVHGKVVKKDYTIRWFHIFTGPLLWKRQPPADANDRFAVPDYRIGTELALPLDQAVPSTNAPVNEAPLDEEKKGVDTSSLSNNVAGENQHKHDDEAEIQKKNTFDSLLARQLERSEQHPISGDWYEPQNLVTILRYKAVPWILHKLTFGLNYDIHAAQAGVAGTPEGDRMARVYAAAQQYPNDVEHCYSFVQVLSACTASFAHGANDVSNAIGPWVAIYQIWQSGNPASSKEPVPIWILIVGGVMISIGLATYGFNIMRVLGNKITYHSPSRGVCMELGAATTVILASQYGIPVSTTMCITGATLGVGIVGNANFHAINWRATGWIYLGWILTIPIAGTLAGCTMGVILNAPDFKASP